MTFAAKTYPRVTSILLVLLATFGLAAVASACPNCKNALADSDPAHQGMVAGYFYSILFMMSVPFVLVGTFGSYAYFIVRRARSVQEEGVQPSDVEKDIVSKRPRC